VCVYDPPSLSRELTLPPVAREHVPSEQVVNSHRINSQIDKFEISHSLSYRPLSPTYSKSSTTGWPFCAAFCHLFTGDVRTTQRSEAISSAFADVVKNNFTLVQVGSPLSSLHPTSQVFIPSRYTVPTGALTTSYDFHWFTSSSTSSVPSPTSYVVRDHLDLLVPRRQRTGHPPRLREIWLQSASPPLPSTSW